MKEPIYRVVLRIIEVKEDAFREWLDANAVRKENNKAAVIHFIWSADTRKEVRRIYFTAKNFKTYGDAERCYYASLREFDFNKKSWQYFKDIRIEKHFANGYIKTIWDTNELTGG